MKANSLQPPSFPRLPRSARLCAAGANQAADRLARLYADLSTAGRRLSTAVADHRRACVDMPTRRRPVLVGLAHAVVDGCDALGRMAELPALARLHAGTARRAGADVVAQADAVAAVAAHLAIVASGGGTGFRGDLRAGRGDLAAHSGRAGLAGLGPNETDETDESLILAAETVSQALSLAARLLLVLARLRARRRRACRLAVFLRRGPATRLAWWVRIASLPIATGVAHGGRIAVTTHPVAVAVAAVAVLAVSVGRRARPRLVGPFGAVLGLLGDLVGVVASMVLSHAVLPVLALVDLVGLVASIRAAGPRRPAEGGEAGWVGFTSGRPRPRRRGHRDQ
jgi:hypothetical protein